MTRPHRTVYPAACLLTALILTPAAALASEADLFEAIRGGDTAMVTALLRSGASLKARDAAGATALMRTVVYLSAKDVAALLDRDADVNLSNTRGATALMWAAFDTEKVRMLLGRGANPNARAADGSTALLVAARFGNVSAMRLLMARGADPRVSANGVLDLLRVAYGRNDPEMRSLLAQAGIRLTNPRDVPGALAANVDHADTMQQLLEAGADPDERVGAALTLPTLALAARVGATEAIARLMARGANPNARGARGLTPLIVAVAANRSNPAAVRMLLDHGADPHARDDAGRTALDWALMRGETEVASVLRQAGARAAAATESTTASRPRSARAAVEAAIARLQPAGPVFFEGAKCISCHHQSLPAMAVSLADARGVPVNRPLASHPREATLSRWQAQEEQVLLGGGAFGLLVNTSYGLLALAEEGAPASPTIDAVVHRLAVFQQANGSWDIGDDDLRPPLGGSSISRAALAIRALSVYAPAGRRAEIRTRIARGRRFLQMAKPLDTHDEAFRLLGLVWSGASTRDISRQQSRLLALQRYDGGWGQWPEMAPDAFATGQALYALHTSGLAPQSAAYRAGADYLLRTQLEDGTWWVRSRAIGFQRYFETGFPHGRDQFISAAATSWAAIALAYTLTP